MSDWVDLQLAHSLTRVQAPDELWARIQAPVARQQRPVAIRWAVPVAIAACVVVLLARPVHEDRVFASSDPAAVAKWMAHEAGVTVPLRPADGMRIKGARIVRSGVVRVSYEVDGKAGSVMIERGTGHVVTAAATDSAACRLCHTL
jgi:hypothetical protein